MPPETDLLRAPLGAVVVGPELFASALVAQGIPVRRVDWRPPGSPEALASLWGLSVTDTREVMTMIRDTLPQLEMLSKRPHLHLKVWGKNPEAAARYYEIPFR